MGVRGEGKEGVGERPGEKVEEREREREKGREKSKQGTDWSTEICPSLSLGSVSSAFLPRYQLAVTGLPGW